MLWNLTAGPISSSMVFRPLSKKTALSALLVVEDNVNGTVLSIFLHTVAMTPH
jgi:hypothetical protein